MVANADATVFAAPCLDGRIAEIKCHGLPPLRLAVLRVDMAADFGIANHLSDVFAILDDRVASLQRLQRDLVPDGDVGLGRQPEIGIVGSDDTQHLGAGGQILDDDDTDVVLTIMNQKLRNTQVTLL